MKLTKTQDKKIDEYIQRKTNRIIAGNVCFDLDSEIIREYWGDDYAEFKFSDFAIISPQNSDTSMICRGWFSDSTVGVDQVREDRLIYQDDIIIQVPSYRFVAYHIINTIKQALGFKLDLIDFDLGDIL